LHFPLNYKNTKFALSFDRFNAFDFSAGHFLSLCEILFDSATMFAKMFPKVSENFPQTLEVPAELP